MTYESPRVILKARYVSPHGGRLRRAENGDAKLFGHRFRFILGWIDFLFGMHCKVRDELVEDGASDNELFAHESDSYWLARCAHWQEVLQREFSSLPRTNAIGLGYTVTDDGDLRLRLLRPGDLVEFTRWISGPNGRTIAKVEKGEIVKVELRYWEARVRYLNCGNVEGWVKLQFIRPIHNGVTECA